MPNVTFRGITHNCAVAYKGPNYVHLVDRDGLLVAAFDGITNFSGFIITNGGWSTPNSNDECAVAVIREDGTIGKGGHKCSDIGGKMIVLTHNSTGYTTTNLLELLYSIPPNAIFYGNADKYYGIESNNLPLQYGMITIYSFNEYRKIMTLNGVFGNTSGDGLTINGHMYLAHIQSGTQTLEWTRLYTKLNPPTASEVGAIPTVSGAKEGSLPVFDGSGKLAASECTPVKMKLSGTTLEITTLG